MQLAFALGFIAFIQPSAHAAYRAAVAKKQHITLNYGFFPKKIATAKISGAECLQLPVYGEYACGVNPPQTHSS